MKETPLPLTVWATRQVGLPLVAAASASAPSIAAKSWPSISSVCQPKARHLSASGVDVHDVLHEAVQLDAVVVHDGHQVVHLVERADHGRFPDLAFLNLAVAQHHEGARRAAVQPRRQRHAEAERQALAQRTGGGFQAGDEAHVGMALEDAAELAQRVQLVLRRIGVAALRHHAVEHRRRMALGEDEAVAVRPLRVRRIDPHVIEVQFDHDFDRRKRSTGMPRFGGGDHLDDVAPYTLGYVLQFSYGFGHVKVRF